MQGQRIPRWGVIVLFPGYIIYNYGVIAGFWQSILSGLFGIAIIIFSFFGIKYFLKNTVALCVGAPRLEWLFYFFILFILLWSLSAFLIIFDASYSIAALQESIYTVLIWLACYFIAVRYDVTSKNNYSAMLLTTFLISILFLHAVLRSDSLFGIFMLFNERNESGEIIATYQGVGRSIVVMAVLISAYQRSLNARFIVLVAAIIILALLGSRAHLFVMVVLTVVCLLITAIKKRQWDLLFALPLLFLMMYYFYSELFSESRIVEIFDLDSSSSWQARLSAFEDTLNIIKLSPIFGLFGHHYLGDVGYAHNLFSAWAQYGVFGFVIFVGLLVYSVTISIGHIFTVSGIEPIWLVAFQFSFISIFLAIFSEPINASVFPALAWGFTVQAINSQREIHLSQKSRNQTSCFGI